MSYHNPVGCCEPTTSFGRWFVKMDTVHNPSYYLVNRKKDDHPHVCLQHDLVSSTATIYFDNEHQAQSAINAYHQYHSGRGAKVQGVDCTTEEPTVAAESQVMEFV